ncbi:MAG: LOG family protein [Deltaproteobacteria bacterium]|jgi:uncharacterized protein (TIGR00730 family)|nr:LOG family protein [Deltaproteobacteria bacterium]
MLNNKNKNRRQNNSREYNRSARRERLTKSLNILRERVHLIELELEEYTNDFFRVCIFGSARIKPDDKMYKQVFQLAFSLGELGIDVLTGGGPGMMAAANKGIIEGRQEFNTHSRSIGISVDLNNFEPLNSYLDIKHHHKKFSSRLDDFMRLSNAVVITAGGIGTLLEIYYTWQLLQLKLISSRPFIFWGSEMWGDLIDWMKKRQLANGLVSGSDFSFIHIVDTAEEVVQIIKEHYDKFKAKH